MKPLNVILLLLGAALCISSCKLDKPILPGDPGYKGAVPPGGGTGTGTRVTSGEYYIKGAVGTQAFDWKVTTDTQGWVMGTISATGSGFESILINTDTTQQQSIDIQFVNNTTPTTGEDSVTYFNNYIPTGTWKFGTSAPGLDTAKKTMIITYIDSKGNFYNNADAQAANANVVSVTQMAANQYFARSLKVKVTFSNCLLQPVDPALSPITLNNIDATVMIEDLN